MDTPPSFSTVRLNSLDRSIEDVRTFLIPHIEKDYEQKGCEEVSIWQHHAIPELLIIKNIFMTKHSQPQSFPMAVVDKFCGSAVLRGAHVFASGILCLPSGVKVGSEVNVFADLEGNCLKGAKEYCGRVQFLGVAVANFSRADLFNCRTSPLGVGLRMRRPLCVAPSLDLPNFVFPQNLPSVLASRVLEVQPGHRVLDMCAAPGGKTSHLAWLMRGQGSLIALEKSKSRAKKLENFLQSCQHCHFTKVFPIDATKCIDDSSAESFRVQPPFPRGSFDRILLDAPCSAQGQRPHLGDPELPKGAAGLPVVQRQLFRAAVELLAPGGILVYSTCTTLSRENEELVLWAAETFNGVLEVSPQEPCLRPFAIDGVCVPVQKFGPNSGKLYEHPEDYDTIGFFIAKFQKISTP